MIKAVIFDMYETLITQYHCKTYFSPEMIADMGITLEMFKPMWRDSEVARSIGKATFEEVVTNIMKTYDCYTEEKYQRIVSQRYEHKRKNFQLLHPDIIPMMQQIREKNIPIALISNCYSEEAICIKESQLYQLIDVPILSWEVGLVKPDPSIFRLGAERLSCKPDECLYIGDGGSCELYMSSALGMHPLQAGWYLKERETDYKMKDHTCLDNPMEVLNYIC